MKYVSRRPAANLPAALAFLGYQLFSNQAAFLEIGVASMLDGTRLRALLLPLNLLNFFANTGAICNALRKFYWNRFWGSGGDGWATSGPATTSPSDSSSWNGAPLRSGSGSFSQVYFQ